MTVKISLERGKGRKMRGHLHASVKNVISRNTNLPVCTVATAIHTHCVLSFILLF
jgi:hypothetical protein